MSRVAEQGFLRSGVPWVETCRRWEVSLGTWKRVLGAV